MNIKTESININTDSEINHEVVADFVKCDKKQFLKTWLMIQLPLIRKSMFPRTKLKLTM